MREFYIRFFPQATRMGFVDRFASLVQAEWMSVSDNYARYIPLARFAPH